MSRYEQVKANEGRLDSRSMRETMISMIPGGFVQSGPSCGAVVRKRMSF